MSQEASEARPDDPHLAAQAASSPGVGDIAQAGDGSNGATQQRDARLRERARQIIREFGEREASVLQQWMAHYMAELMERIENPALDAQERAAVQRECARVIDRIWRLNRAREATQLGYAIYQHEHFGSSRRETDRAPQLAAALAEPSAAADWSSWDRLLAIFDLAEAEQDIVQLLINSYLFDSHSSLEENPSELGEEAGPDLSEEDASAEEDESGEGEESTPSLESYKRLAREAQTALAPLLSDAGSIVIDNYPDVAEFAEETLLKVHRLKAVLLEGAPGVPGIGARLDEPDADGTS